MKDNTILAKRLTRVSPLSIGIVLIFAALMTYLIIDVFAASGTATLYTSPSGSKSVKKGDSFTLSVRISSGSSVSVTAASVYLTYPTDKLQVKSESYNGSPYNTQLLVSNSGGVLRMDRAAFPSISGGDKLFAQVTFKAVSTGSASIGFSSDSVVTSGEDDSNILSQKKGVSYSITSPASSTSSSSSKPSSSNSSAHSGSSTSSQQSSSSSATAKTDDKSPGSDKRPEGPSSKQSETAVTTLNEDSTATGDLTIVVVDKDNNPVESATVIVNGQSVTTDKNGNAKFQNLPLGKYDVVVSYKGNKTFSSGEVKSASTDTPSLTVKINKDKFNPFVWIIIPLIGLVAAAFFLIIRPRLSDRLNSGSGASGMNITSPSAAPVQPAYEPKIHIQPELPAPGTSIKPPDNPPKP